MKSKDAIPIAILCWKLAEGKRFAIHMRILSAQAIERTLPKISPCASAVRVQSLAP
jgi:hypothetical protein